MYVTTIYKRRGHRFEDLRGGERDIWEFWREQREGGNYTITSKNKQFKTSL